MPPTKLSSQRWLWAVSAAILASTRSSSSSRSPSQASRTTPRPAGTTKSTSTLPTSVSRPAIPPCALPSYEAMCDSERVIAGWVLDSDNSTSAYLAHGTAAEQLSATGGTSSWKEYCEDSSGDYAWTDKTVTSLQQTVGRANAGRSWLGYDSGASPPGFSSALTREMVAGRPGPSIGAIMDTHSGAVQVLCADSWVGVQASILRPSAATGGGGGGTAPAGCGTVAELQVLLADLDTACCGSDPALYDSRCPEGIPTKCTPGGQCAVVACCCMRDAVQRAWRGDGPGPGESGRGN